MEVFKGIKVKLTDFELLQTIGTGNNINLLINNNKIGSFGRVRLAKNKLTAEYVAIKMLKKAEIIRLKQVDHIISENTILSNINHPFLVIMNLLIQNNNNQITDQNAWILSRR